MKKKKSIKEKVKEFLGELWLGKWGRYDDDEDEDREPEEDDPNFRLKWKIEIPKEDSKGQ